MTLDEFLARGPLQPLLPLALRGADGRVRMVVRACRGGRLPGALPVRVPRQPRHAVRTRLASVAHGDRWIGELCGEGRQAAVGGQPPDTGEVGQPDRAAESESSTRTIRPPTSTRSSSRPIRTRRSRCCPNRPRPRQRAGRVDVLQEPRCAAHRRLDPAAVVAGPRRVELPDADCDAAGTEVHVTYDMTRLQRLPSQSRYLVTFNGDESVDPDR